MKRIYVCSPYSGDVARNIAITEALCRLLVETGHAAFAPHLFYTRFLDDNNARQRETGLAAGMAFLEACDELWAFVERGRHHPSPGMEREIAHAHAQGIRVNINPIPFLSVEYQLPGGGPFACAYADVAFEAKQARFQL